MWTWIKYILIFGTLGLVALLYIKWNSCRKKGEAGGVPYSCPLFCSNPVWLIARNIFYAMNEGKCYEVTEYNKGMSYRMVELEKCGERAPVLRSDALAEYELME